MPKLIFLHGFLGAKEDWDGVVSYLKDFECHTLSYPFVIPQDGILVGYSMGGRIATSYPNPKILISSHPGLLSDKEKNDRLEWENKWLTILEKEPFFDFLTLWYDQPLFSFLKKSPQFPAIFKRRLAGGKEQALMQFKSHLLSNFSPQFMNNSHFLCGTEDIKYVTLYNKLNLNPLFVEESSHACHLEQPKNCARLIYQIVARDQNLPRHQIP